MIFSKKKITIAYTIEQCTKCKTLTKREFHDGDVLFSKLSKCTFCDGLTMVEKIYGESTEQ